MKIRNIILTGALALACAGIVGCSKSDRNEAEVVDGPAVEVLSVDSILNDMAAFEGDTVTVVGICSHLCKHGGKKAFLQGSDSTAYLMCVADSVLDGGAFAPDCPGKELTVMGVVAPMKATLGQLESAAAVQASEQGDGHCDTEQKAHGTAAFWLDSLQKQIAAGGDSTITTGYYIIASSYGVAE